MINVLNLGYGNAASICNTLEALEYPFELVAKPSDLKPGVLIVPGVGSIGVFAENLLDHGWESHIQNYANQGNNIIGICLGLHALTAFSEESGGKNCMNLLPGNIQTTILNQETNQSNTGWLPFTIEKNFLDQVGWSPFFSRSRKKSLKGRVFYNHIYGAKTEASYSLPISDHEEFASVVASKNIMGIQFHPEKSQLLGKLFLEFIL
jgi:imidazole glycerol-phosphate synthase subunit HisH